MANKINPVLPSGFRDYLPEETIARNFLIEKVRGVFEIFGFVPIDTPCVERRDVLVGNGDTDMQIFNVPISGARYSASLRFDLTVPLASFVSRNISELSFPFKRYQLGRVWRAEKPQKGRYREFIQFDIDTIGSKSMMVDSEVVAVIDSVMRALNFSRFLIRVNNRKVLNGLSELASFDPSLTVDVLRSLDKLEKFGWDVVQEELMKGSVEKVGVGLRVDQVKTLKSFVDLSRASLGFSDFFGELREMFVSSTQALEGIDEMEMMSLYIPDLGVSPERWEFDLSVARGLGYYTGPVFETTLIDLPEIGSVFSGGRYDGLVERFSSRSLPATGASLGFDRIFAAMQELELIPLSKSTAEVLVANFDPTLLSVVQKTTTKLRTKGIATELYFDPNTSLKEQIIYAIKKEIPFLVIIGEKEEEEGSVTVRDLRTREQVTLDQKQFLVYIAGRL